MKFTNTLAVASFLTAVSVSAAPLPTAYDGEVEVRDLAEPSVEDLLERFYDEEVDGFSSRELTDGDELLERGLRGFGKNAFTTIAPAIVKMVGGHDYRKRPMPITRPIGFNKRPAPPSRARPAPLKWQGKPRELTDDELSERNLIRTSFKKITSPGIPPDAVKSLRGHPSRLPNVIRKPNGFPYSKHLGPAFRAEPAPLRWQGKPREELLKSSRFNKHPPTHPTRKPRRTPVKNQVKRELSSEIGELD
ncbi:hypothetical protein DFP72DRAFT_1178058 [Ephemerocybe angulata]|uniref:Uncharacterized protein n=1 Tax=Ephemerocybe angulata TaxID=980116 RepID=A0A8H6LV79_9AGAR|nr:hypothetical protein DFP72DRAFT_1178058 [Tulosesus angulatus]